MSIKGIWILLGQELAVKLMESTPVAEQPYTLE